MGLFNFDNVFFRGMNKLVDCVYVSFLWLICCIPIFTIGASTSALYYTSRSEVEGPMWGEASFMPFVRISSRRRCPGW